MDDLEFEPGIYVAQLEHTMDIILVTVEDNILKSYSLYNSPGHKVVVVKLLDAIFDLNVAIPCLCNRLSQYIYERR